MSYHGWDVPLLQYKCTQMADEQLHLPDMSCLETVEMTEG